MSLVKLSSEKYFYTIQGEGKYMGVPSIFIRMSGCNLRCAWKNIDGTITLCDTPHTSFNPEFETYNCDELIYEVIELGVKHIVITGGEPFLQKELQYICQEFVKKNHIVTIETNGTIYKKLDGCFLSISPKLSTSNASEKYKDLQERNRINYETLSQLVHNHDFQLKFVINNIKDVEEINYILKNLNDKTNLNLNNYVWLMPQGTKESQLQEKMQYLFDVCKTYRWNYTDRLHIRAYGQRMGV